MPGITFLKPLLIPRRRIGAVFVVEEADIFEVSRMVDSFLSLTSLPASFHLRLFDQFGQSLVQFFSP